MIEKLNIDDTENCVDAQGLTYNVLSTGAFEKINKLVDAVNELQKDYDNVCVYVGEQKLNYNPDTTKGLSTLVEEPEPTDPYAKYRKWAGKLCRFWDEDKDRAIYDILEEVIADWSYQFKTKGDYIFDHCELVKPDDDIIYKGE